MSSIDTGTGILMHSVDPRVHPTHPIVAASRIRRIIPAAYESAWVETDLPDPEMGWLRVRDDAWRLSAIVRRAMARERKRRLGQR